jgi:hypothetical protein
MKKTKKLTLNQKLTQPSEVESKMETLVTPAITADENNARIDRVFSLLYKLRGSDLKGLADEIENEGMTPQLKCNEEYLFHVSKSRMATESDEGVG